LTTSFFTLVLPSPSCSLRRALQNQQQFKCTTVQAHSNCEPRSRKMPADVCQDGEIRQRGELCCSVPKWFTDRQIVGDALVSCPPPRWRGPLSARSVLRRSHTFSLPACEPSPSGRSNLPDAQHMCSSQTGQISHISPTHTNKTRTGRRVSRGSVPAFLTAARCRVYKPRQKSDDSSVAQGTGEQTRNG